MNREYPFGKRIQLLAICMSFILGFGIDLYSPSFPSIEKSLHTSEQLVQLTIATYFAGYVLGQILLGPISDSIGRRKPLIYGLGFYTLMSLLCSFSHSITMLLIFRVLQGVGVSMLGVGFRSILSDSFTGKKLAASMNYTSMSYRLGPIIAPFLGGYLEYYFGWQYNFYFLALIGLLLLVTILFLLPETHHEHLPFELSGILARYREIFRFPPFIGGGICTGILYGMMIIFNVVGPFFIQNVLGFSAVGFGYIALLVGIFAFFGGVTNRIVLHYLPTEKIMKMGIYALVSVSVLQVFFGFLFPKNLYCFVVPVLLNLFFSGFVASNMMSRILDLIPIGKGTASALLGILIITCTGILTTIASFLKSTTIVPFSLCYLVLILIFFASYKLLFKRALT